MKFPHTGRLPCICGTGNYVSDFDLIWGVLGQSFKFLEIAGEPMHLLLDPNLKSPFNIRPQPRDAAQ